VTTYAYAPSLDAIVRGVSQRVAAPVVVAVSGFGGSGKTALAAALACRLGAPVVGIDAFGTPAALVASADWGGLDRARLVRQVLAPLAAGAREVTYDRCDDWDTWRTTPARLRVERHLVVEGVGLFHPGLLAWLHHRLWLDVPLATATARGIARDMARGQDTRALWEGVWAPTETAFARRFRPRDLADVVVRPCGEGPGRRAGASTS